MFNFRISRNLAETLAAHGITAVLGLLSLKLSAELYGPLGFGEYNLARRTIAMTCFTLLLGLGIGIPRFIAIASTNPETKEREYKGLIVSSLLICLFTFPCLSFLAIAKRKPILELIFGEAINEEILVALLACILGTYLHTVVYGYLCGLMRMRLANFVQILQIGIVPVFGMSVAGPSVTRSLLITGCAWIFIAACLILYFLKSLASSTVTKAHIILNCKRLIGYGFPRVPGEFALFAMFSIPSYIIANRYGIEEAGFFSFGVTLLQMVSTPFAPVGTLLLPQISRLLAGNEWREIQHHVNRTVKFGLLLSIIVSMVSQACLPEIVSYLLGPNFEGAVVYARKFLFATIPYVLYILIRNPQDAISSRPINSFNLVAAMTVGTIFVWFEPMCLPRSSAVPVALFLLGILSCVTWKFSMRIAKNVKPLTSGLAAFKQ